MSALPMSFNGVTATECDETFFALLRILEPSPKMSAAPTVELPNMLPN